MIQRWLTIRTIFCSCTFALCSLSRVEHCSVLFCWALESKSSLKHIDTETCRPLLTALFSGPHEGKQISRGHLSSKCHIIRNLQVSSVQMGTVSSSIRLQLEESRAIATALVAISQGLCHQLWCRAQLCTQSPWTLRLGHDMGTRKSWMRLLCFPEWAHDSSRTKKK